MSSPPQQALPRHRRAPKECPAAGCEKVSTSPRARRTAPMARVSDAPRPREAVPIVVPVAGPGRAMGRGAGMRSVKRREGPKRDENVF
jgi:hypothetical protein